MTENIINILHNLEIRKSEIENESNEEKLEVLFHITNKDIVTFINFSWEIFLEWFLLNKDDFRKSPNKQEFLLWKIIKLKEEVNKYFNNNIK